MTVATSKRSRTRNISKDTIDQLSTLLQELPEKPRENLSLRKAVEQLRDQIEAALAKGYSYDDLAATLTQQGIAIRATTLKQYIPSGGTRSNRKRPTTRKQTRKQSTTDSAPLEISSEPSIVSSPAEEPAPTRKRRQAAAATPPSASTNGRRSTRTKSAAPSGGTSRRRSRKTDS